MANGERWDPLDTSALDQIRLFEADQPNAMGAIVQKQIEVLRMTQALLLNGTQEALRSISRGKDHETPLFFCIHTIVDDLRQAELNLALGYTVAVSWALRDAIEAVALASLLWRDPPRATSYWAGHDFAPSEVRRDLEKLGLWSGMVASLWTTYTLLSGFTHPTVDRLAQVMDERRTESGIEHTFNAGGTRDERKLRMFEGFTVGCCFDVLALVTPIMKGYLSPQNQAIFEACVRDVARKTGEALEANLAKRHALPNDMGEATAYEQQLRKRLAKPMAIFENAVAALEESRKERSGE